MLRQFVCDSGWGGGVMGLSAGFLQTQMDPLKNAGGEGSDSCRVYH